MARAQLPRRGIAHVEEKMAPAIPMVGHESDARQPVGIGGHVGNVHPIGYQPAPKASSEIVVAHHADETAGHAQAGNAVSEYGRCARGERADKRRWPVQGQVRLRPHDLHQCFSDS